VENCWSTLDAQWDRVVWHEFGELWILCDWCLHQSGKLSEFLGFKHHSSSINSNFSCCYEIGQRSLFFDYFSKFVSLKQEFMTYAFIWQWWRHVTLKGHPLKMFAQTAKNWPFPSPTTKCTHCLNLVRAETPLFRKIFIFTTKSSDVRIWIKNQPLFETDNSPDCGRLLRTAPYILVWIWFDHCFRFVWFFFFVSFYWNYLTNYNGSLQSKPYLNGVRLNYIIMQIQNGSKQ